MALIAFCFSVRDLAGGGLIDLVNPRLRVHRIFPLSPDRGMAAFTFSVLKPLIRLRHTIRLIFSTECKITD
jgi:hypothetical protein